jgi:hypothetical protein
MDPSHEPCLFFAEDEHEPGLADEIALPWVLMLAFVVPLALAALAILLT